MTEKLYMYGFLVADIGQETEDQCQVRLIAALELVSGVYRAERVPHMVALDQPGEISLALFIEQGADLDEVKEIVAKIPGIKYQDLSGGLVRGPAPQNNPPCGQPGHQCGCPTKKPTPKPE